MKLDGNTVHNVESVLAHLMHTFWIGIKDVLQAFQAQKTE